MQDIMAKDNQFVRRPARTKRDQKQDEQFARLYAAVPSGGSARQSKKSGKAAKQKQQPELSGKSSKIPKPRWRVWLKRVLLTLLVVVLLGGLYVGGKFVYNGVQIFGWQGFISLFTTRELRGEAQGRVNILVAGNAGDQPGHGGADLTDSIMLLSINTRDDTGYILSMPRDLYVDIPQYGFAKINEAYPAGERMAYSHPTYPAGGMGLLAQVVSERTGVPVHYYALLNYTALEEAVNAVGGIDIVIDSPDPRGVYDPNPDLETGLPLVDLPNGPATLDGREALNLARARGQGHGSYGLSRSDFDRTEHQRKIVVALADKTRSFGTLSNPLTLGQLLDSVGNNVITDMNMGEMRRLYIVTRDIDTADFALVGLNDTGDGTSLLQSYRTPTGQAALIPRAGIEDYTEIRDFIQALP